MVDRLDKKAKKLISTKSLDTAANGYQKMSKLKNTLNKYADALQADNLYLMIYFF
ncbi:MAG: hypothetical protein K6F97_11555 [Lachnospiraceae bacterium]|nr:hypothetical protein [Lachnospiraceae bacterium]